MEAKPYPEEKRRHLIDRGNENFIAFLEQVEATKEGQRALKSLLPTKVKGFRPGHAPLKRTVPILIIELKKESELSNSSSLIWASFKNAWAAWVRSHDELNPILLELDNAVDFDEKGECTVPPNSELDIQCFKHLLDASENHLVDKETIERFYDYGYFLPSEAIEVLIEQAHPRAEIERQRRIAALPALVDQLFEDINSLNSKLSAIESADITTKTLNQRTAEVIDSFERQLSETKANFNKSVGQLKQSINSRLSKVEDSVKSLETQLADAQFVESVRQEIEQLGQTIEESVHSLRTRQDGLDKKFAEIETDREEQHRMTNAPRIANQAVRIGGRYNSQLREDNEHYLDEIDYLWNFTGCLRRFGVTNSGETGDEMAAAIHIALKTFPALAVNDTRIFKVWQLMCGNHLHVTEIGVEMGWLGLQDWFPELFSQECFGEQLRRMDLDISIRRMLEIGDMPWAIHMSNCDRSFPESYLPRFLDWIGELSDGEIRIFLTRSSGVNRCGTTQDVYARVARLLAPEKLEPIEARNLQPRDILTRHEWKSWCQPNHAVPQVEFLNQLQEAIENAGTQIPLSLLCEIQRYVQLSHGILETTKALDWALTLRLLPWILYRREAIETVWNLINQGNHKFPRLQKELLLENKENE